MDIHTHDKHDHNDHDHGDEHRKPKSKDELSVEDVKAIIDRKEIITIVDVREKSEWELANLKKAKLAPLSDLKEGRLGPLAEMEKNAQIILHCQTGVRSMQALRILRDQYGFTNIKSLYGGLEAWEELYAREIEGGRTIQQVRVKSKVSRRVTLVRPPYSSVYEVYGHLPKDREIRPPLGLLYVAGALEEAGHKVKVIDGEPESLPLEQLYKVIMKTKPEVVGFTATTPEFFRVETIAKWIKRDHPKVKVMVGGAHVSALPQQTSDENPEIDYIICGEGEIAAVHIVNNLPENERVIRMPVIKDLNDLPKPAKHLVDYENYQYAVPGKGLVRMDAIESSRGCPFLCTFCFNRATKPRYMSPKRVVEEMKDAHDKYGVRFFMFFDDTFTIVKQHVLDICDEIIKAGLHKTSTCYVNTRANTTDYDMLIKMKEAGLTEISMGVETGSPEMMIKIQKGTTHEAYEKFYAMMHNEGLQTRGSFIVGHPHETHKTVRETIDFAKKVMLMRASCNILTPYPGTYVYTQAMRQDGIKMLCKDWKEFKRWGTSVIETDELTKDDLEYYQERFLTEFYTQPKVLWYHLKQIFQGNLSFYFYRPLVFAIQNRIKDFIFGHGAPSLRGKKNMFETSAGINQPVGNFP